MKFNKTLLIMLTFALLTAAALPALALETGLDATAKEAGLLKTGLAGKGLPQIIGYIISIFLGLLGILFFILIIYGGYTWMTSFGDAAKAKKAKELITDATIGLVIVLAAYAISNYVIGALAK